MRAPTIQTCIRCHRQTFDHVSRNVADWPLIDDANASEHCQACWMEMGKAGGREFKVNTTQTTPLASIIKQAAAATIDFLASLHCPTDQDEAWKQWQANCGPCAVAALLSRNLCDVRHAFPGHETRGYAAPKHMQAALTTLGVHHQYSGDTYSGKWPDRGFVRVQWCGAWLNPGVHPGAAWSRTHWIAVKGPAVYDCNPAFWVSREDWAAKVAPEIMQHVKGCNGQWKTAGIITVAFPSPLPPHHKLSPPPPHRKPVSKTQQLF